MKKVTDPALLEQLEGRKVTDPAILAELEPKEKKGFIDSAIDRATGAASALASPEFYKQVGQELSNFPPVDPNNPPFSSPDEIQAVTDIGLMANPVSRFAKASRMAVMGKEATDVQKLASEGVRATVGQKVGGAIKDLEESLKSVPFVRELIKGSQNRGIHDFNRAAINRALDPIGKSLPKGMKPGTRAIDYAHSTLSQAYEDLLPKLSGKLDDELVNVVNQVDDLAKQLPEAESKQLTSLIEQNVFKKFGKDGSISGEQLNDALSRVKGLIRKFGKSENPNHQIMSEALESVETAVMDMLKRYNPTQAGKLESLRLGWANLMRVEKASVLAANADGIFTPAQLMAAVKATDSSLRKTSVAHGKSLMQDLAVRGQNVLAPTLADSGTAFRVAPWAIAAGAGAAGQQGWISPETALTVAGMSLPFTRPGQVLLRGAASPLAQRTMIGLAASEDLRSLPSLRRRNLE